MFYILIHSYIFCLGSSAGIRLIIYIYRERKRERKRDDYYVYYILILIRAGLFTRNLECEQPYERTHCGTLLCPVSRYG